jgi:GT2 family glycosyltransferase
MSQINRVKIVLIILTYNQKPRTVDCLGSVGKSILMPKVIVWDNGSTDDSIECIKQRFPEVDVYKSPENLGVALGRNTAAVRAIEKYDPEFLLFLDNDMIIEKEFVSALLQPFASDERIGQTQAKLRFVNDPNRLNDGGGCKINFMLGKTKPVGFEEIDSGQYDTVKECISCGGAMMVRTKVFQQLGGFDALFNPFGPEDLDFSLRLQKAGYKALYVPEAVAYHAVSHTFGEGYSAEYARLKLQHWLLFLNRHAKLHEKIVFFAISAPILFIKILIRESLKGNFSAIAGLIKGVMNLKKIAKNY